jgi:hypothetical protein
MLDRLTDDTLAVSFVLKGCTTGRVEEDAISSFVAFLDRIPDVTFAGSFVLVGCTLGVVGCTTGRVLEALSITSAGVSRLPVNLLKDPISKL